MDDFAQSILDMDPEYAEFVYAADLDTQLVLLYGVKE